jgi:hypothetical protein
MILKTQRLVSRLTGDGDNHAEQRTACPGRDVQ